MLIINDLPLIFALFALIFGALGVIVSTIPQLKEAIPSIKRDSFTYVLAALLLFMSLFLKNNQAFFTNLNTNNFNLASVVFAKPLGIQPEVQVAEPQLVLTEPELDLRPEFVTLSISSNPVGADVFVEDVLKGKTPLELQLAFGTAISYKVVASEALESESGFAPFEAVFAATEDTDLSIWLDRLD